MRPDFLSAGAAAENSLIDAAIERIAESRDWSRPQGPQPTVHLPELKFWHGFRIFSGRTGIFFYDQHTCQGLMGVMNELNGPVDLFRFTTVAVPG